MLSFGCSKFGCNDEVVNRVKSIDSRYIAIHSIKKCGATVSNIHNVSIIEKNHKIKEGNIVLKADKVEDLILLWRDNENLEISYTNARIWNFKNFASFQNNTVHILEKPGR